jgi:hypothetical protein
LYTFQGTAGQQVTVTLSSTAFDSYLIVVGPTGAVLVEDDDSGGNHNARIQGTLPTAGTYTIEATAYSSSGRGSYALTASSGSSSTPCLIFVHGTRDDDKRQPYGSEWSSASNWQTGRDYWRSYYLDPLELFEWPLTDPNEDFVHEATNGFTRPYYVVRYNGAAPWWSTEAAKRIATEIVNATSGGSDPGRNSCGSSTTFWVVAHSGGATVMDFILGNSRQSDPYLGVSCGVNGSGSPQICTSDAPYGQVANRISLVISVGGAHRGSPLADVACPLGNSGPLCTDARLWLKTDPSAQVSQYAGVPGKPVWLVGGAKPTASGLLLAEYNDGTLPYASQFACAGDPNGRWIDLSVCDRQHKQEQTNFFNIDSGL